MTRSEQSAAHGLQWTYRSLGTFRRHVLRRREECLLVLQMPREAFSEHMGLSGGFRSEDRRLGQARGWGTSQRAACGAHTCARFLLLSLVYSFIHPKNTSRSPALCQVLLQPRGAEQGTRPVHKVVREPDSEQI